MKPAKKRILIIILTVFFSLNTFAAGSLDACGVANTPGLWTGLRTILMMVQRELLLLRSSLTS